MKDRWITPRAGREEARGEQTDREKDAVQPCPPARTDRMEQADDLLERLEQRLDAVLDLLHDWQKD